MIDVSKDLCYMIMHDSMTIWPVIIKVYALPLRNGTTTVLYTVVLSSADNCFIPSFIQREKIQLATSSNTWTMKIFTAKDSPKFNSSSHICKMAICSRKRLSDLWSVQWILQIIETLSFIENFITFNLLYGGESLRLQNNRWNQIGKTSLDCYRNG